MLKIIGIFRRMPSGGSIGNGGGATGAITLSAVKGLENIFEFLKESENRFSDRKLSL